MKNRITFSVLAFSFVSAFGVALIGQEKANSNKVPDVYKAKFETSAGDIVIAVHREWAPIGADRFHELVSSGFFDDTRFFRAMPNFMVQLGLSGDPKVTVKWKDKRIKDDPVMKSNKRGMVTFAKTGAPNSRTTQIFINTNKAHNTRLDSMGFAPFGEVIEGMEAVDKINTQYGEGPQEFVQEAMMNGNKVFDEKFPKLDRIKKATILSE